MSLHNISVRAKLICAFSIVLAITIVLGAFSINRLAAVNFYAADVRDNWLPATGDLGRLAEATERLRAQQSVVLITSNDDARRAASERVKATTQHRDKVWESYAATITPQEKELVAEFAREWKAYLELS